ncbi:MAG: hypothetical protein GQ526_09105 [Ardenticatenales bacterium]|nr:hypothetical protein [Ardenticatenales bacterium]
MLVLLVAAAIRLPTLTWRSLDFDEGASLHFSSLPYTELITHFADLGLDRHPRLYSVLLKAWRQIGGDADVMLRLPSALAGMLTVAIVYQLGRRRLGEATAGFAALLIALNPLVIYQNQDARMYALALLFSVLAVWALWNALYNPRSHLGPKLGVFSAALALAAYMHAIAATLFPVLGLMLLVELFRRRRAAVWGLGALAASAAVYAPYLVNIIRTGNTGSGVATVDDWVRTTLGATQTLLDFQSTASSPIHRALLLGLLAAIVVVGVWRGRRQGAMVALWFLPVLALTILASLRMNFFQTKIYVFSAVPLALLTSLACLGRSRKLDWRGTLPALAMLSLVLYSLSFQWRAGNQREDLRSAARFVGDHAAENDTVVLHLAWSQYVFGHYYPDPFVHPFANNVDSATPVGDRLAPFLDSEVVWLVQVGVGIPGTQGDPDRVVQGWLAERYPVVTEVFPNGVDVRGYATRYRFSSLPETATRLEVDYPNELNLVGYRLTDRDLPTRDLWLHPPSTWVPVALYWSASRPLSGDIRISILLEDEQGNVWGGNMPREKDLRAFYPPLHWQPGEIVRWDFDVNANPDIRPGEYKVVLRVYEIESGAALAHAEGGDWLILDRVRLR